VACLVAILGSSGAVPSVTAFHHAWIFMIACSLLAGAVLRGIGGPVTETADASDAQTPAAPTISAPARPARVPSLPVAAAATGAPAAVATPAASSAYVGVAEPRTSAGR
jgi:hypothetical protein